MSCWQGFIYYLSTVVVDSCQILKLHQITKSTPPAVATHQGVEIRWRRGRWQCFKSISISGQYCNELSNNLIPSRLSEMNWQSISLWVTHIEHEPLLLVPLCDPYEMHAQLKAVFTTLVIIMIVPGSTGVYSEPITELSNWGNPFWIQRERLHAHKASPPSEVTEGKALSSHSTWCSC